MGSNILAYYDLAVNLNIKVSKPLSHWLLLLASFRFCETQYLHFTTRVFGHSAITPFLGGYMYVYSVSLSYTYTYIHVRVHTYRYIYIHTRTYIHMYVCTASHSCSHSSCPSLTLSPGGSRSYVSIHTHT